MSIQKTLARPYAKAAFELAVENEAIPTWSKFLTTAAWVVTQSGMKAFLQNPKYTAEQRYQWMLEVCESVVTNEHKNFLKLLADNKRLSLLPEITEVFNEYCTEHEKTAQVLVKSAYALNNEEKQQLSKALKIKLQRDVTLEFELDKSILGGLVIRAGDLVIDDSIRRKLTRLENALTS